MQRRGDESAPKLLAFRFDVDSHRCIRAGVPNLLDLGRKTGARFTFFVNMGRAIDRIASVRALFRRPGETADSRTHLSAREKLGLRQYLVAALLNPRVGGGRPGVIRRMLREGHEVGLHGGRNHASWQAGADEWDEPRFRQEVAAGRRQLLRAAAPAGIDLRGFASPGWQGPPRLWPILAEYGFEYVADTRGRHLEPDQAPPPSELWRVPTHLVGEPGGVAYLEYHQAAGRTDDDVLADFERALQEDRQSLVLYDHPYYAGIQRLALLDRMIEAGRRAGYRVETLSQVLAVHRAGEGS